MRLLTTLLLACTLLAACSKKSEDATPANSALGTDMGYGTLTFKGKTYFFSGYSYVPSNNLGAAAGTVVYDTTVYTLSINLTPAPKADTTYHLAPHSQGALVNLLQTSTTSSRYSKMYYFEKETETVGFTFQASKRAFMLANLTETDQFGVPIANGETVTATLKQK